MKKYIFHFESNPNAIRCLRRIVLTNYNLIMLEVENNALFSC